MTAQRTRCSACHGRVVRVLPDGVSLGFGESVFVHLDGPCPGRRPVGRPRKIQPEIDDDVPTGTASISRADVG